MEKSILRCVYEDWCGETSDRNWNRIRRHLCIQDESDFSYMSVLEAYALMRKLSPRGSICREQINQWVDFFAVFPDCRCRGDDLIDAVRRVLKPKPSKATLYRWGQEIGIPLSRDCWYSRNQMKQWLAKILCQRKFRPTVDFPPIRKLATKKSKSA